MKITDILCKMGIHRYEDHITVGRMKLDTMEIPVESKEICRWCKKIRKDVKFYLRSK